MLASSQGEAEGEESHVAGEQPLQNKVVAWAEKEGISQFF